MQGRRHLVVAFTDGHDTTSVADGETLAFVAGRADSLLHLVLSGAYGTDFAQPPSVKSLRQAAEESGGELHPPGRFNNVLAAFRQVVEDFRQSYVLRYTLKDVKRDRLARDRRQADEVRAAAAVYGARPEGVLRRIVQCEHVTERETLDLDVLIVGGGPAGMSAALRLAQLQQQQGGEPLTVGVLDKSREPGAHMLSGAVLDPSTLHELDSRLRSERRAARCRSARRRRLLPDPGREAALSDHAAAAPQPRQLRHLARTSS